MLTDERIIELLQELDREWCKRAVRSLLAGNDVGCFTEEQYQRAYERVSKNSGWVWRVRSPSEQLRETGMVHEVRPGVWAPCS